MAHFLSFYLFIFTFHASGFLHAVFMLVLCCKEEKDRSGPESLCTESELLRPQRLCRGRKARFVVADSRLRLQFSAGLFISDTAFSLSEGFSVVPPG